MENNDSLCPVVYFTYLLDAKRWPNGLFPFWQKYLDDYITGLSGIHVSISINILDLLCKMQNFEYHLRNIIW